MLGMVFILVPSRATCHGSPCLSSGKEQDLVEKTVERIKVAAPEIVEAAVVQLLITGEQPESRTRVTDALDLAE